MGNWYDKWYQPTKGIDFLIDAGKHQLDFCLSIGNGKVVSHFGALISRFSIGVAIERTYDGLVFDVSAGPFYISIDV